MTATLPKQLTKEQYLAAVAHLRALEAEEAKLLAASKPARAKNYLIPFAELMMPDPADPTDFSRSRYLAQRPHKAIAAVLEEVEAGRFLRVIIVAPPRHGKTQLASRSFIPWFVGKDPYRSVIFATYNEEFAVDIGREVREIIQSPEYPRVFPRMKLRKGSASAQRLVTEDGGTITFVGRGGALTGRGADCLLIDDPIKDDEEAQSPTIRNKLWDWFTRVAMTRLMTSSGRVILIQTRWHEDDLVGRLTDPQNPCYNPEEAKKWRVVHLPALAEDGDALKRPREEPLWPERFTFDYLNAMRQLDPRGFSALYQGRPTPEDGDFFRKEYLRPYRANDLPSNLRIYVGSDHAVSTEQRKDSTVIVVAGVSENDDIFVLDCWWRKAPTDVVVEAMLTIMRDHEPMAWYAGKDHISQSIGPFLRKRMLEERIFVPLIELAAGRKDKSAHAQPIRARAAQGKVFFPTYLPWWQNAKAQLLKFPNDAHDDFVDALAMIGRGLHQQFKPGRVAAPKRELKTGTLGWIKQQTRLQEQEMTHASGF